MAAAGAGDSTQCPLCLFAYAEPADFRPYILNCGHSFCSGCLQSLGLEVHCPTCRCQSTTPPEVNFALLDVAMQQAASQSATLPAAKPRGPPVRMRNERPRWSPSHWTRRRKTVRHGTRAPTVLPLSHAWMSTLGYLVSTCSTRLHVIPASWAAVFEHTWRPS